MALYNALRYNYADVEGCTLLVDIGSRTTNLLFCEPGKIFPRRLNIGGSTITTALGKDLQASFTEADQRKVDDGFVSLGGSYAEPDDVDVARISKIIRNQMTRLHQEIARSITFYRSEHGGNAPVRVLLAGGTASLAYMREFFQEKFAGMEVDYFNPLRNVSVAASLDVDAVGRDAHTLGEVVGLALRSAVSCPMELNLRPASVVAAERLASQRPFMIAAGVLVLAGLASWWQYNTRAAEETRKVTADLSAKVQPLKSYDQRINATRGDIEALQNYAKPLIKTAEEREYWSKALADLNSRLPAEFIWITAFELPSKEDLKKAAETSTPAPGAKKPPKGQEAKAAPIKVFVRGIYLSRDAGNAAGPNVVDTFANNLKESSFFEPVLNGDEGFERESDDTQKWGFRYAIPLLLKNPIDLK
jgi:type IV pilus assembly protein PilM